jgi:Ca2+-binding EF-hand superfamily protein
MNKTTLALLAGAAALAAATAFANPDKKDGDWEAKLSAHFAEIDANTDGNISGDEFLAYKAAEAQKHWDMMAANAGDDGVISLEEMKAHHKAMKAEMKDKKEGMEGHENH